jgi:hypothetical protein
MGRYGPASPAQTVSGTDNAKKHDFEMVTMPITPNGKDGIDGDSMAHRR